MFSLKQCSALIGLLLLCHVLASSAVAVEESTDKEKTIVIIVAPKSGSAASLSEVLAQLLDSDSVISEAPESNTLFIRVPVDKQERVSKLVAAMDRPRPMISVELIQVRATQKLSQEQLARLSGPTKDVHNALSKLVAEKAVSIENEFQTKTVSNTTAEFSLSHQSNVVTGFVQAAARGSSRVTQTIETGTIINLTPLALQSAVMMDLSLTQSEPKSQPKNDEDTRNFGGNVSRMTFQSTLRIDDGYAQVAKALVNEREDQNQTLYLIVTASIQP